MSTFPSCFRFSAGSYAAISDASLNDWSAQTIAFWIWVADSTANIDNARILEKGSNDEWAIILKQFDVPPGTLAVQQLGGIAPLAATSDESICDALWHFIAVTIDSSGTVSLYVDNVLQGTPSAGTLPASRSGPLNIAQYGGGSYNLNGALNEVAIWNRVLSDSELMALWNSGNGVIGNPSIAPWNSGLELLCHLDEGSGTTFNDSGPHALNASLVGSASWVSPGANVALPIPVVFSPGNPFDSQLMLGVGQ